MIVLGSILLFIALWAMLCALISAWAASILVYKCLECSPDELVNDKTISFPILVKITAKMEPYKPLISRIANANCLSYTSDIVYYYDKKTVIRGISSNTRTTENSNTITETTTYTPTRSTYIDQHEIQIFHEKQHVGEFALVGPQGSRIKVDSAKCPVFEIGSTEKLHETVVRNGCDSSGCTLRIDSNPNFEYHVNKALPTPHRKAHFEIKEKWAHFGDDQMFTVYGSARKENGDIVVGNMKTCLGERMIVSDWSIQTNDRVFLGFGIGCSLLALALLIPGLVLVL